MPYISIRNAQHYYEWICATDRTASDHKPVMVFLHGWAGSARYWETTAYALTDTFDCLLYDLRGFGRSRIPADSNPELNYELTTYAEDLAILLDSFNLKQVYLNSHSMGASIATLFLNLYPQRVEKAILTCSGIFDYDEKAFAAFHKFSSYIVKFRPPWLTSIPFVNQLFMARFLHRSLPDAVSRAFLDDFLIADYEAAFGTILTSVNKKMAEEMPGEFARLKVPTLLVAGAYDKIIPAIMGKRAADLNDLVEFAIIPKTAHFPMLEDAPIYLQRIREFLPSIP